MKRYDIFLFIAGLLLILSGSITLAKNEPETRQSFGQVMITPNPNYIDNPCFESWNSMSQGLNININPNCTNNMPDDFTIKNTSISVTQESLNVTDIVLSSLAVALGMIIMLYLIFSYTFYKKSKNVIELPVDFNATL